MQITQTPEAPLMLSVSGARGIVGRTMTPEIAAAYGAAFGSFLKVTTGKDRPLVVVGLDGRISGPPLAAAAIGGLMATGCDVIDIGVAMTPTVGVMISERKADGGLAITASHNPIAWNGIKCLDGNGLAPPPAIAKEIVDRFKERRIDWCGPLATGKLTHDGSAARVHIDRVLRNVDVAAIRAKNFTVVLDSVNGSGCVPGRMMLEELGCTVVHIYGEQTGIFGHVPEPLAENLLDLAAAVRDSKGHHHASAACGFAQDPDADRLAIVDERGSFIGEEYTLVLAALRMLQRHGSGALATNLSTSRMIDDVAALFPGSHVVRTAVGEANVVAGLRPVNGILGGEGNGGVILPTVCWVRDSLSAMALVLELLAHQGKPLSAVVTDLPRWSMVKKKFELSAIGGMAAVAPALAKARTALPGARVSDTDGIRLDVDTGWVHLRASNTEPIIRLIAEGRTAAEAEALIATCAAAVGL
ncbi:MAG: phosphoglucosamine mutase [Phycisphaerales bacterium]|nr:phosphoglucosamine mutase [Phycisphaerales bacterium]